MAFRARCQRGESGSADKSQDEMTEELLGEGPETTSILRLPSSRLLEAWWSGAPALGDLETLLHLQEIPFMGRAWKSLPSWLSDELWAEHTV